MLRRSNNALIANVRLGYSLGWSFTPLAGKRPILKGWQKRPREAMEEALAWAAQGNVGLRTGRTSGVVVIDGLAWDYEASFQVIVRSYPSTAHYLERHGDAHVRGGKIVQEGPLDVGGRRAFWMRVTPLEGEMIEDHVFVESGDGRVLIVIMEAPRALRADFAPWFDAMLATLQVHAIAKAPAPAPPPPIPQP